jgi:hypothetical protein
LGYLIFIDTFTCKTNFFFSLTRQTSSKSLTAFQQVVCAVVKFAFACGRILRKCAFVYLEIKMELAIDQLRILSFKAI